LVRILFDSKELFFYALLNRKTNPGSDRLSGILFKFFPETTFTAKAHAGCLRKGTGQNYILWPT
jgi:hypothetical protein